jgi:hypothetical protein
MRAVLAVVALTAGCSTAVGGSPVAAGLPDEDLVAGYFAEFARASGQGAEAQADFLRRTQHPDFISRLCDLRGAVVRTDPAMTTLRPDPRWAPESGNPPRGKVYVIAVALTVSRDGEVIGEQIGSERIVVLDGVVHGFMPCLRES